MTELYVIEYQIDDEEFRPLVGESNVVFKDFADAHSRCQELFNKEAEFFENDKEAAAEIDSFAFRVSTFIRA